MTPDEIEATRPAFEAFMRSRSIDVTTQTGGWGIPQYVHSHVDASWFAWQAAKADATPAKKTTAHLVRVRLEDGFLVQWSQSIEDGVYFLEPKPQGAKP